MSAVKMSAVALAAAVMLGTCAGDARGSYQFFVDVAPRTTVFGAGGTSRLLVQGATTTNGSPGTSTVALAAVSQSSTRTSGTDTTFFPFHFDVHILNVESGLSGSFAVDASITVTRSDVNGFASTAAFSTPAPPSLLLGDVRYLLDGLAYTAPQSFGGFGTGGITGRLTEVAVPEPGAGALAALGLCIAAGLRFRFRF